VAVNDSLSMSSEWELAKFNDPTGEIAEFLRKGGSIEEAVKRFKGKHIGTEKWKGNIGLQEGRQELIDIICGLGTPTKWDNTNARLGVGDSNAPVDETHTGLQAPVNKSWKGMDATYPQRSAQTAEWRATWGSAEGNYAWEEYTVVNASDDAGKNLNRCITSKGTKASGETWTLGLKITFNPT